MKLCIAIAITLATLSAIQSLADCVDYGSPSSFSARIAEQEDKISTDNKGVSLAMAMAAIPQTTDSIGIGFSQFEHNKGFVIGATKSIGSKENTMVRITGGESGKKKAGTVGISWKIK